MTTLTPIHDNQLYLYYLQLEDRLGSDYIHLAASFKSYNITLVPIQCSELDYFINGQKIPLIVITDTTERFRRLKIYRHHFLDFALRSQSLYLYHLNSFGLMRDMSSYEKSGHYLPLALPLHLDDFVEKLVDHHYSSQIKEKKWPGGKRVGLPKRGGQL